MKWRKSPVDCRIVNLQNSAIQYLKQHNISCLYHIIVISCVANLATAGYIIDMKILMHYIKAEIAHQTRRRIEVSNSFNINDIPTIVSNSCTLYRNLSKYGDSYVSLCI